MIRFLVDEDFNNDILRGLRRRLPDVDAPRIQALGLTGVSDETGESMDHGGDRGPGTLENRERSPEVAGATACRQD